ncbi:MAG: hypothetical protein IKO72_16385 [Kiritimatiellae bacterium]|nr:hypothetical protein [Kiritimatiellia bacterium]
MKSLLRMVAVAAVCMAAAGCCGAKGHSAPEKIRVACIGDSITFGTAMTNRVAECYPAQLQRILGDRYEVRNFGDPGAGVYLHTKRGDRPRAWRLRDEYAPALAFKPDIVVCNLGINDASTYMGEYIHSEDGKAKLERGLFRKLYVDLLESFANDGCRPRFIIWTKLGPTGKKHHFKGMPYAFVMEHDLEQVARDVGAETLDMYTPLVPFAETPHFSSDGIHPEAGAQKVIAEITAAKIQGRPAPVR